MKQILGEEMFLTRMSFSGVAAIVIGIGSGPIFEKPIIVPRFKHAGDIWKGPIMAQVVPLSEDDVAPFPDKTVTTARMTL